LQWLHRKTDLAGTCKLSLHRKAILFRKWQKA
jgi:hypothetical protein